MIMFIVNLVFVVIFWNMSAIAAEEGRIGWAYVYLFCSALNGAALCASIF